MLIRAAAVPRTSSVTRSEPSSFRAARLIGAGALAGSTGIHLDLYLTGYRRIPTIGPLFLVQVVATGALALAIATRAWNRERRLGDDLLCAAGGLAGLGTLAAYLVSLDVGLFGFREVPTTAGAVAGGLELATAVLLLATLVTGRSGDRLAARRLRPVPAGLAGIAVLAGAAALAAGLVAPAGGSQRVTSPSGGRPGAAVTVTIRNFAYVPAVVRVAPGTRIRVVNDDSVTHTLTATSEQGHPPAFNTGLVAPGTARTIVAPRRPGRYPFFCEIHQFMTGVLVVT
jgi:plastocyanin